MNKNIIEQWNEDCGYNKDKDILFIKKLKKEGFNEKQISKILKTIEMVCIFCWNGTNDCQCWNDA